MLIMQAAINRTRSHNLLANPSKLQNILYAEGGNPRKEEETVTRHKVTVHLLVLEIAVHYRLSKLALLLCFLNYFLLFLHVTFKINGCTKSCWGNKDVQHWIFFFDLRISH
jgi:hypothetical protein